MTSSLPVSTERSAGRELDALVAEHVMKWTEWKNCADGDYDGPKDVTIFASWQGQKFGVDIYEPADMGDVSYLFEPSSDMGDAWRVVEKLRERFQFELRTSGVRTRVGDVWAETDQRYVARFVNIFTPQTFTSADTAELAISLAALKALGVE